MENTLKSLTEIKGWGIDRDKKNDPTYPIKNRTDGAQRGYSWERPPQQTQKVEVLQSVERINMPAVFGTAIPPHGLSGRVRRYAFKFGEGNYGHWLPLLLADRINVAEGLIDDFKKGIVPNIFAERGMKAEWKYNKKQVLRKFAVGFALFTLLTVVLRGDARKAQSED